MTPVPRCLAVPANDDDFIFISSGTWSLMGIERMEADCSEECRRRNLTNEGGYGYRFRYLKNIMGLWMIQSVRHEFEDRYSFAEICQMAEENRDFPSRVDANDERFLAPESMTEEVKQACADSGQPVPQTLGEIVHVIYASLAECYARTAGELEEMAGRTFGRIHIVGGGSNAEYLNRLTPPKPRERDPCRPLRGHGHRKILRPRCLRPGSFPGWRKPEM